MKKTIINVLICYICFILMSNFYVLALDIVNVKDSPYNASGDGITNDTTAITSAIDAIITTGGGTLYFPPGTYRVTSTITKSLNKVIIKGNKATIKKDFGENPLFILSGNHITLEGIVFFTDPTVYNTRTTAGSFLYFTNANYVEVYDNSFFNCTSVNLYVRDLCNHIIISKNTFKDSLADGVQIANGPKYVVVADSTFENTGDDCVGVVWYDRATSCPENIIIIGNIMHTSHHRCVAASPAKKVSIVGNHMIESVENAINIAIWDRDATNISNFNEDIFITGNTIKGCGSSATYPSIFLSSVKNTTAEGNIIENPTQGIQIGRFSGLTIKDNIIRNCRTGRAIHLLDAAALNVMDHLLITKNTIDTVPLEGIYFSPYTGSVTATYITIEDNLLIKTDQNASQGRSTYFSNIDGLNLINNKSVDPSEVISMNTTTCSNYICINNYPSSPKNRIPLNGNIIGNGTTYPTSGGSFQKGDIILNTSPTELGLPESKYVISHWICITGGSPGTWLPCRYLTGN